MSEDWAEINRLIKQASDWIDTWPAWKRNILVQSSQPTVSKPREPVDNFADGHIMGKPPETPPGNP